MTRLALLTLRGRVGQVAALAATILFSAVLIGALGTVLETGARGQVSTGEYGAAPLLVAARQTVPVSGDVDMPVPGRAVLPGEIVDEIARALPGSRVVPDRVVPAILLGAGDQPVDVHPWSAFALGDRQLTSGHAPSADDEVVVPASLAGALRLEIGDTVALDLGNGPGAYAVVGTTSADDSRADVPDTYVSDTQLTALTGPDRPVVAVGIWPHRDSDTGRLDVVLSEQGARVWAPADRGSVEVVAQGPAKANLVAAVAALASMALIVALFTVMAITSLQIRERSRELATLRIVGAAPRQVNRLLLAEIRLVAAGSALVGGLVGPLLGGCLVVATRSLGALPRSLDPVIGPLPFAGAVLASVLAAEIAARVALRRVVQGSPLHLLTDTEAVPEVGRRVRARPALGLGVLCLGIVMAAAPAYTSNLDVATGLPGLSGLVMALSIGALSPSVVRGAARLLEGWSAGSAGRYLALRSIRHRAARVGGALTPLVLGVALATVQFSSAATGGAVAADQQEAGHVGDLTLTSPVTGLSDATSELVRRVPGVGSAASFVTSDVVAVPDGDNGPLTLPAFGVEGDDASAYADLGARGAATIRLDADEVALGVLGAAELGAEVGDVVAIVLADGTSVARRVIALYDRGLGFGEVFLPMDDLRPATPSGQATGIVVTALEGDGAVPDLEQSVRTALGERGGLEVSTWPFTADADAAGQGFQVLMLAVLFGYIAIAVTNSIVVATLSRRPELELLAAVGASSRQRRSVWCWEGVFVAVVAIVVGTTFALVGLSGMAYALSNGERHLPSLAPALYLGIVVGTFALVLGATALSVRAPRR